MTESVQVGAGIDGAKLGRPGSATILTGIARERAIVVLADPLVLKQIGAAAAMLAVVNQRCGDGDQCRLKYGEIAQELNVSETTVKAWAKVLERLGFITRTPCGPAGVDIRLCPERWPDPRTGTAGTAAAQHAAEVVGALRLTMDSALQSVELELRGLKVAA